MTLAISTRVVAAIVVFVIIDVFAIVFGLSFLRAAKVQRDVADGAPAPARKAPAMSRRDFFRKSLLTSLLVFGAQFGGATIAFLWPSLKGGFGSRDQRGGAGRHQVAAGRRTRRTTARGGSTWCRGTARPPPTPTTRASR